MRRYSILLFSFLNVFMVTSTMAQNDDDVSYTTEEEPVAVAKKPVVKMPTYPTMEVKGICIDAASKQPLAGVLIQALGDAKYTAMTDDDGTFTIKVPTFATALYVHSPEFLSQQVGIGHGDATLRIEMLSDKFRTMYDKTTRFDASATAKMTSTTSHTIETDIENELGGDVRSVTRSGGPGYGTAMFIRGMNSLNANAQPLFVVDGIIQDIQQTRSTLHYGDYTNLLLNFNPEDIEQVTVLKNATALYGAKGANGVVLIETKRGHSMATRIDANIGVGVTLVPKTPDMMDAGQYRLYVTEMLGTHPNINDYTDPQSFKFLIDNPSKYYYTKYHNDTDWKKEVYHTSLNQNYNINVQGGDDIGMYNLSLGYTDAQSPAKKNSFNRLNVRFNTDINIIYKLTTRFDMSFAKINRNVFDNGAPQDLTTGTISSPTFLALVKSPFLNPYTFNNQTGKLSSTMSDADDYLTILDPDLTLGNPTALLSNGDDVNKNRVETTHFNTVIAPRYEFNPNLSLTETFSYSLDRVSQRYYRPKGGMPTFLIDGIGRVQNMAMSMFSKETSVVSDTRLEWKKQFREHTLDIFGGLRFTSFGFDDNSPKGQYSSAGNDKMPNITTDMDFIEATGTDDEWRGLTWYANVDYNYRNRYYAQLTMAMESSSRFGSESNGLKLGGVRWGLFPSLQLGWVVSNESWFPQTKGINYLLLKTGYDISGNDDINNYAARTSFGVSKYLWRSTAAILNNIGNESITWEQTGKFNIGLTAALLNNRLAVDFDYFYHHTTNLLTLKSFSNPIAGINNYWSNGGSLDNQGFELSFTTKPIVTRNLGLEIGASIGHYVNKVKTLPNDSRIYVGGKQDAQGFTSSIYGQENIATIVGLPVGMFYGYKTDGVFADDQEAANAGKNGYLYLTDATGAQQRFLAGDTHFVDINGDGEISLADKTVIGNPNPDIYGNIFATLNWKNLTLHVGFNYSLGNDIYNYQRSLLESGMNFYNQTSAMTNRWRAEGQKTDIPRISYQDPMGNSRFSDRWIENGSYLRLKTVRLNYQVPVNFSWLQGLAIWAEANNLLTFTHYLGNDPEMSVSNSVLYQGIDAGNVALGRTFTLGMRINL